LSDFISNLLRYVKAFLSTLVTEEGEDGAEDCGANNAEDDEEEEEENNDDAEYDGNGHRRRTGGKTALALMMTAARDKARSDRGRPRGKPGGGQGLTLVQFSAQPQPFLSQNNPKHHLIPPNTLYTLSKQPLNATLSHRKRLR
jgi:hypothetical protein